MITPAALRRAGFSGLRVVGDVHGEAEAFEAAIAGAESLGLFIIQLGDLVDYGPDSPGVLRRAFTMLDAKRGIFLLGNHEHKLRRALIGHASAKLFVAPEGLGKTLEQLNAAPDREALATRAVAEIARAPAWLRLGQAMFIHAAYHDAMLFRAPPEDAGVRRPDGPLSRALYGEVTGQRGADGYPVRATRWVGRIPHGITAYVGHDNRSTNGRPHEMRGALGGRAIFLDTGAGKGGALAWIDLPFEALEPVGSTP
jgi:protein phosphatase